MRLKAIVLILLLGVSVQAQDCLIGNTEALFGYDEGWLQAPASYAQFLDPTANNCTCDPGFVIDEVRIDLILETGATVLARALLLESDNEPACPVPGLILATSPQVLFDGAAARDAYEIVIPCGFQCAVMDDAYFLVVEVIGLTGVADLPYTSANTGVSDKQAPGDPCTAYMDTGSGWEDMILAGFGGGLPIEAAVTCCGDPIVDDADTWGWVKRMYKSP